MLRDNGLSFDQGLSGTAFTLNEVWKATGNAKYRDAGVAATQELIRRAYPAGDSVQWLASPAVGQGGGIVLYLLTAARTLDDEQLLQVAQRAGKRILELGSLDPFVGRACQPREWDQPCRQMPTSRTSSWAQRALPSCSRASTRRRASPSFSKPQRLGRAISKASRR